MHAGHARSRIRFTGRRAATLFACLTVLLALPAVGASAAASTADTQSGGAVAAGGSCPSVVNARSFASAKQLRKLVRHENRFGERFLASSAHNRTIDWIKDEVRAIKGFKVRSDPYKVWRWLPRTKAKGRPGLDLGRAGGLSVTARNGKTTSVPVAGAVRWSKPTGKNGGRKGRLVYLGSDQEITAANSAGKVVVRDFPGTALP